MANDADAAKVLSSFRLKTTLTVFIGILIVAFTGLTFLLVSRIFGEFNGAVRQDLAWKAERGALEIAQEADLAIAVGDRNEILNALGAYRTNADVEAIVVVDAAGRELLRHGSAPRDVAVMFNGPERVVMSSPGALRAWAASSIEGKLVGRVAVAISLKRLESGDRLRRKMLWLAAVGCATALFVSIFFVSFYLGPLLRFAEQTMLKLRDLNATLEHRVEARTAELRDANGRLTESLQKIQSMQRELIDTSRRAGMADVATAVLHNVGNVLNSVNVSAGVVGDMVRQSRLVGLQRAVDMIKANEGDLGRFLTQDDRGKRLPAYLQALASAAAEERTTMQRELESLQKNIEHIKVIVSRQQAHAKSTLGVVETVSVKELLEDAISFNSSSYEKHKVEVVRDFGDLPQVRMDRHKVFQIIMNLLSNARQAVKDVAGAKRITVRTAARAGDRLVIEVEDTGCGIAPENLHKIFSHGFTTKKEGHGFGLHASANAAREMNGSLVASSDGPGKGARFTLELPLDRGNEAALRAAG